MQQSLKSSQAKARPFEVTFGKDRFHLNEEMAKWCRDKFGLGGYIPPADGPWMMRTMFGNTTFAFRDEKQYTWFILRWQ